MQFKTKLLCYFVPSRASGVYKEAEKLLSDARFMKHF